MTDGRGRNRSSAEIRAEIAATRARLAEDIEAAQAKLSRRGLQYEAMGAIRNIRSEATGAISGVSHSADRQANQLGHLVTDTVKRYPVVTTLVGLGLALLAFSNGRRSGSTSRIEVDPDMELATRPAAPDLPPTRY